MHITPIGAAGEVTGSCFMVDTTAGRFLVDCGMFQGADTDEQRNRTFDFSAEDVDAVLLTHAHLDHCGRVPLLHFLGFRGPVYATPATCDLLPFMWLDSAKVFTEDFERRVRKSHRLGRSVAQPLYREEDVLHLLPYLRPHPYEKHLTLGADVRIIFHQSGHILGSACVEIREGHTSVLFSGDLGAPQRNVVPDPAAPPHCDLVICESTYGDRQHRSEADSIAELRDAIRWADAAGGNVIIPSFALERTQDLLFVLRGLFARAEIPDMPVFVDSPLAINLTRVYQKHIDDLDAATQAIFAAHGDPFTFPGLTLSATPRQSQAINGMTRAIIIAGSGMCNGGRVVHHLRHNLWREDTAVVFVGYQARGTLGRRIVDRAPFITLEHERIAVKARVCTINGFSAHADQLALLSWLGATGQASILLNHGEDAAAATLSNLLASRGRIVALAEPGRAYDPIIMPAMA